MPTRSRRGARGGAIAAAGALACVLLAGSPGVSGAAYSTHGAGAASARALEIEVPDPPTVTGIQLLCALGVNLKVSWDPPPAPTEYTVYASTNGTIGDADDVIVAGPTPNGGYFGKDALVDLQITNARFYIEATMGGGWPTYSSLTSCLLG